MKKIVFKDITGIIYSGKYNRSTSDTIEIEDLNVECGASSVTYNVVNLKSKRSHYDGEVTINMNNIIWYSIQDV